MICSCGSNRFLAHQLLRVNVIVDEHGEFEADLPEGLESSIYDSEPPLWSVRLHKLRQGV